MAPSPRIVILGGHGKVALLLAPKLAQAGYQADAVIRNPDHKEEVQRAGANPIVLDLESADLDALQSLFQGAHAVVFSAGAGGKGPASRTRAVDFEAAIRTMDAAKNAAVQRYIMVSYANAKWHAQALGPDDAFYPYAKAKQDADAYLRNTDLDYTILGPGVLTLDPATRTLQKADENGKVHGETPAPEHRKTSRENVAEAILYVLKNNAAVRQTVNFYEGDTPLNDVFS